MGGGWRCFHGEVCSGGQDRELLPTNTAARLRRRRFSSWKYARVARPKTLAVLGPLESSGPTVAICHRAEALRAPFIAPTLVVVPLLLTVCFFRVASTFLEFGIFRIWRFWKSALWNLALLEFGIFGIWIRPCGRSVTLASFHKFASSGSAFCCCVVCVERRCNVGAYLGVRRGI